MRGKLTRNGFAQTMPVHADPLSFTNASFRGVNQVTFSYRTDTDAAAALLPAELEIEQNPKVSVMFLSYGFSSVGPFREYIHIVHARFRGAEVGFVPHIFISNERGMLAGREREGYPKLLGEIDFDMNRASVYGLVTAQLSRPAGITLAQGIFRPSELVGEISEDEPQAIKAIGLRVFGSAFPGGPLTVCELVPSTLEFYAGEIWSGDGSLIFTGASAFSAVHGLPIVGAVEATAFYNAAFRLRRPTETYPHRLTHFMASCAEPSIKRKENDIQSSSSLSSRSVAITGAGGGLGREIALGFAAKGYAVFGTAMSDAEVRELAGVSAGQVRLTICDMTQEAAVQSWTRAVSDALRDAGLDLLINNAGILTPGPIEVLPLAAIRREFDVNVFGALSVINAFLPALRKARGRIVQVSTWTASVPLPFNGPSGASKAAMEVFATVYRA